MALVFVQASPTIGHDWTCADHDNVIVEGNAWHVHFAQGLR